MSRLPRKWTPAEDGMLLQRVEAQVATDDLNGNTISWNQVAVSFQGRSNKDCRKRWFKLRAKKGKGGQRAGAWEPDEDQKLRLAYDMHGPKWSLVAESVGTRNADQCSKRWQHCLNPSLNRTGWSPDEDANLLAAVSTCTLTNGSIPWKQLKESFPGRSTTSMKNRHTALVKQQRKDVLEQGQSPASTLDIGSWPYQEDESSALDTNAWSCQENRTSVFESIGPQHHSEGRTAPLNTNVWSYPECLNGSNALMDQEYHDHPRMPLNGLETHPGQARYSKFEYTNAHLSSLRCATGDWSTEASSTASTPMTHTTSTTPGGGSIVMSPSFPVTDWDLLIPRSGGSSAPLATTSLSNLSLGLGESTASSPSQHSSHWNHHRGISEPLRQLRPRDSSNAPQEQAGGAGMSRLSHGTSQRQELIDEVAAKISSTTPQTILILDNPKAQTLSNIMASLAEDTRKVSILMNTLSFQDDRDYNFNQKSS